MSSPPLNATSRLAVVALIGGALFLAVFVWRRQQAPVRAGKQHPAVGKAYLPHEFQPLTAKQPVVESELSGKVVLVNFWGWWCGPCQVEFPHLMDLEKSLREIPNFRFVSVACSRDPTRVEGDSDLRDRTEAFLTERRADISTYIDPRATELRRIFEISGDPSIAYPTTIVIGRDGTIRGLWLGYQRGDELDMRAVIDEALQ